MWWPTCRCCARACHSPRPTWWQAACSSTPGTSWLSRAQTEPASTCPALLSPSTPTPTAAPASPARITSPDPVRSTCGATRTVLGTRPCTPREGPLLTTAARTMKASTVRPCAWTAVCLEDSRSPRRQTGTITTLCITPDWPRLDPATVYLLGPRVRAVVPHIQKTFHLSTTYTCTTTGLLSTRTSTLFSTTELVHWPGQAHWPSTDNPITCNIVLENEKRLWKDVSWKWWRDPLITLCILLMSSLYCCTSYHSVSTIILYAERVQLT